MTEIQIDIRNNANETFPDDSVVFWSPMHRPGSDHVVSTAPHEVFLEDGQATTDLEPGPTWVKTYCRGMEDTYPKLVVVPEEGPISFLLLMESSFEYTPPVLNQARLAANRAEQARDDAIEAAATAGLSAYDLAVQDGYSGSLTQWLSSLRGPKGDKGNKGDKGDQGGQGIPGDDAYTVAVQEGYSGTRAEWLASLRGPKGDPGSVDNHTHKSVDITDSESVAGNYPERGGKLFRLGGDGYAHSSSMPATSNHLANKNYVDTRVATRAPLSALETKADLVGGKVPTSQIPAVALTKPSVVSSRTEMVALVAEEGDVAVITGGPDQATYMLGDGPSNQFASWIQLSQPPPSGGVSSINGQTGAVVLGHTDVGALPSTYTPSWTSVLGKPSTFPPETHNHAVSQISATGTASSTTYLRGDGSWATPTNTTYSVPTQAEAEAGTATTGRAFSAQRVAQAIAAKAAPKTHTHTVAQISDLPEITPNIASSSLVQRHSDGGIQIIEPVFGSDPTTKNYVDGRTPPIQVVPEMPASPVEGTVYIVRPT